MNAAVSASTCTLEELDRAWVRTDHIAGELYIRWESLWERINLIPRTGAFETVLARWNEPQRSYHTARHLLESLKVLDHLKVFSDRPDLVEFALWHHDAIYNVKQHDNEERSAELACNTFVKSGGSSADGEAIRKIVMATMHRYPVRSVDAAVAVDADLAILGAPPVRFDEYEQQVRREYSHVQDKHYASGRLRALQLFVNRDAVFRTPLMRTLVETRAQENLKRSFEALRAAL